MRCDLSRCKQRSYGLLPDRRAVKAFQHAGKTRIVTKIIDHRVADDQVQTTITNLDRGFQPLECFIDFPAHGVNDNALISPINIEFIETGQLRIGRGVRDCVPARGL